MSELVDDLIQICGLSLIDIVFYNVTKFVQLPAIAGPKTTTCASSSAEPIPVVFHEPGELLVVDKPADLVINSNDKSRVSISEARFKDTN